MIHVKSSLKKFPAELHRDSFLIAVPTSLQSDEL